MKNAVRKGFLFLLLAALVVGGVFAQRVGDTVQLSGQNYRVQEARDGRVVLQLVPSLDGVWVSGGVVITINGNTGVFTQLSNLNALFQDALNKGHIRVGEQYFRNLRSTGNLTWSGQMLEVTFNTSNRNVATGTRWGNYTITMSADGQSIEAAGITFTRRQ